MGKLSNGESMKTSDHLTADEYRAELEAKYGKKIAATIIGATAKPPPDRKGKKQPDRVGAAPIPRRSIGELTRGARLPRGVPLKELSDPDVRLVHLRIRPGNGYTARLRCAACRKPLGEGEYVTEETVGAVSSRAPRWHPDCVPADARSGWQPTRRPENL